MFIKALLFLASISSKFRYCLGFCKKVGDKFSLCKVAKA
ncbi:hypothetical protein UNSW1_685 [Campylobacter concisus UNSW1]|nr:hypothetical protein UNSW1_685 [Campylobacter concisus UNSW1]